MVAHHIKHYYNEMNTFAAEMRAYEKVNMRYYFPNRGTGCPSMSQLNFNGEDTWCYQLAGRRDAQKAL
jgi:hypothetical protein